MQFRSQAPYFNHRQTRPCDSELCFMKANYSQSCVKGDFLLSGVLP